MENMKDFINGFEKQALSNRGIDAAALAATGLGIAGLAGLGAFAGHDADVALKMDAARRHEKDERKTWVQKNPKLSGMLSLGLAPGVSQLLTIRDRDAANEKVRKIRSEHPFMTGGN